MNKKKNLKFISNFSNINYKYFPQTKEELQDIIKQRIKEEGNEVNLNDIDVSNITDMSYLDILILMVIYLTGIYQV